MADPLRSLGAAAAALPVAPSEQAWRAMTLDERERFLDEVNAALSDPQLTMVEGRPHKRAKSRALDMLGLHFKAMGRVIYLAEEMAVVYPGKQVFTPDVLAVLDVEEPDDDARMAWVVADEGRGLDLALEVLHRGDRKKDLVDNVERYASLGIAEYFVYDWGKQQLHGYRLASPDARRYERIVPQSGRYHSSVLGLDLVLERGSLRFYLGMAELIGSADLIDRLTGMVDSLEAKAELAEAKAVEAEAKAGEAEAKAGEAEAKAGEAEAKAGEAEAKVEQTIAFIRGSVLAVLGARGIAVADEVHAQVMACDELALLQKWLFNALSAETAQDLFAP
jgi:Uma2 family endonuclease